MSYPYRVELTIGPYTWIRHLGDPPALPEILDNLVVGWQFPDADLWPVQPEPVTASLSLLAYAASDLAAINIGTTYHLRVYAGAVNSAGVETPTVRTAGRVAQLDGSPRYFIDPVTKLRTAGWQLDVQLVDYTADAAEITVSSATANMHHTDPTGAAIGLGDMFSQIIDDVLTTLGTLPFASANPASIAFDPNDADRLAGGGTDMQILLVESDKNLPLDASGSPIPNQPYGPGSLADLFDHYLALWVNAGSLVTGDGTHATDYYLYASQGWRRPIYRSRIDAAGNLMADEWWRLEWVGRRNVSSMTRSTLPLKFAAHDGVYGPVPGGPAPAKAQDSGMFLSAGTVDLDANWARTKQTEPNTVVLGNGVPDTALVRWHSISRSDAQSGDATIAARLDDVPHLNAFTAGFLADMYNGDNEQTSAQHWAVGDITWYASRDPSWPRNISLFPDAELWQGHNVPIVIGGIPATQVPTTEQYVGGPAKSVQFTLNRGEFTFELGLYPRIPRPARNGGAITCADLAAGPYAAVKFNQLDAATSITYRLVHATALD